MDGERESANYESIAAGCLTKHKATKLNQGLKSYSRGRLSPSSWRFIHFSIVYHLWIPYLSPTSQRENWELWSGAFSGTKDTAEVFFRSTNFEKMSRALSAIVLLYEVVYIMHYSLEEFVSLGNSDRSRQKFGESTPARNIPVHSEHNSKIQDVS